MTGYPPYIADRPNPDKALLFRHLAGCIQLILSGKHNGINFFNAARIAYIICMHRVAACAEVVEHIESCVLKAILRSGFIIENERVYNSFFERISDITMYARHHMAGFEAALLQIKDGCWQAYICRPGGEVYMMAQRSYTTLISE